jgi:hypothetical protein
MTGTTPNYGWEYVNSGADAVSGPANFAFVPDIDETLGTIAGNIVSMYAGNTSITAVANEVTITPVTISPALQGDSFLAIVSTHTSVPGTVVEVAALNETATGFDIYGYRTNDTNYSVNWVLYGIREE